MFKLFNDVYKYKTSDGTNDFFYLISIAEITNSLTFYINDSVRLIITSHSYEPIINYICCLCMYIYFTPSLNVLLTELLKNRLL